MPKGNRSTNRGRGPKPGTKYAPTIAKEAAREVTRQLITAHIEPMIKAQVAAAQGLTVAVIRRSDGTFRRIDSPEMLDQALADGETKIDIHTLAPSTPAFTDLMNRALDKPKEQAQDVNLTIHDDVIKHLNAARKRAQSHNP